MLFAKQPNLFLCSKCHHYSLFIKARTSRLVPAPKSDYQVPVYHVLDEEIEPAGLPEDEDDDDDYFEVSERGLDNATSTVYHSEATEVPWVSLTGDAYTEMSGAYEDVTADGSAALDVQPTESWEADLLTLLTNVTSEPVLSMMVSYVLNASGFCQANISCMRSDSLPSTRLAICALDPSYGGLISEEALLSKVEPLRLIPIIESVNSTRVSALEAVKEDRLVFCASGSEVTYELLTAEGCDSTWIRTLLTNCFLFGGIPSVLLIVFTVFIVGLRGRERQAPSTGAFVYFTADPTIPDVRMNEEALQMSISGQTWSRTASPPSLNIPSSFPTRPHGVPGRGTRSLNSPPSLTTPRTTSTRQHRVEPSVGNEETSSWQGGMGKHHNRSIKPQTTPVDLLRPSADKAAGNGTNEILDRQHCVVVQGLLESNARTPKERMSADLDVFQHLLNKMLYSNEKVTIRAAFRIGKKVNEQSETVRPRPLFWTNVEPYSLATFIKYPEFVSDPTSWGSWTRDEKSKFAAFTHHAAYNFDPPASGFWTNVEPYSLATFIKYPEFVSDPTSWGKGRGYSSSPR
ncbi:hypothetical protein SprV_0902655400 [Sparganum proliferum]